MLPFLKPQKLASVIIQQTMSKQGEQKPAEADEPEMRGLAEKMLQAIEAKDTEMMVAVLMAIRAMEEPGESEESE